MTFPKCAHTFKINKKQSARRMLFGRAPAGEHNDYATNYLRRAEERLVNFQNRFEILTQITPDYSEKQLTDEERNQVFEHPQQNNNMKLSDNKNQAESNSNEKDADSSIGIDAALSVSSSVVCCNSNNNNNNNHKNNNNDINIPNTNFSNNHNIRDIKINVSTSCNNKCNTKAAKQTDITDYFTIRVNLRPIQNKKDQRNSCNKEADKVQSEDIDDSDING